MTQEIERMLDRRFEDFEKLMDTRLQIIQAGVEGVNSTMGIFVEKMANMHTDYVPRREIEREQEKQQEEIDDLHKKVEVLQAWRNYLAGAIGVLVLVIGWVIQVKFN